MQSIEIHPSRTARTLLVLLTLAVPLALSWAGLSGWWLGAMAWITALWWTWRGVFGLGAGQLTLRRRPDDGWEIPLADDEPESLIGVRPLVVATRLVVAELQTEQRHYALVLPADTATSEDLRRLRQLLLSNHSLSHRGDGDAQSEGRGT